jgi:signal transduction histidine kinase
VRTEVETGAICRDEIRLARKDGVLIDAGLTVSRSGDPADGTRPIVVVVRDISQEKALQGQQSRFIATASHELRTPITNLRTRLYLVQRDPQRMAEHLEVINDVTLRMQRLVEDLLDQSRFERGLILLNLAAVELQQLLSDVVRVQSAEAEAKDIRLSIRLTNGPQIVRADAERLTQVITNLVTNSLHYTPLGGSVEIGLATANQQAIITVKDTGMGIAPENLDSIFKPFVRGNELVKGTGLGLSIAREIVELHNGTIWAESKLNEGSSFFISLQLLSDLTDAAPGQEV